MEPNRSPKATTGSDDPPFAFLVTTAAAARATREHLGSPAYSYGFVLNAFKPVLERLGTWQLIDRPESRLAYAAQLAREDGYRPIHLAIAPLQDVYQTPAVPTVLFPFWEFPHIPDRDFQHDTRQNWARVARPASLILTACRFTASAFRSARVRSPVAVVPVPVDPAHLLVPAWEPQATWTLTCRHAVLRGGEPATDDQPTQTTPPVARHPEGSPRGLARRVYHRVYPWLDPKTHQRIAQARQLTRKLRKHSPPKLVFLALRAAYKRGVRPWLSEQAVARVTASKERLLRLAGVRVTRPIDPPLPASPLTLSGLVYTTVLNVGDLRKNIHDLMSAFLLAFRDRADVTLVMKLATNPVRERHEVEILKAHHAALGIRHRCRIVLITEYLDDETMRDLLRATTFYVNASHAEGACLPLQNALAAGRPVIAPDHTAMADYIDETVAFVIRSHPEPTHWPHDPEHRIETERLRPVWSDLYEHYLASAEVAEHDQARYTTMADAARRRMAEFAGYEGAEAALRQALDLLPDPDDTPAGDFEWSKRAVPPIRAA